MFLISVLALTTTLQLDAHTQIQIQADQAQQHLDSRTSTWQKNVIATQGPYTLHAHTLTLSYNADNKPCVLKAVGTPVHAYGPINAQHTQIRGEVIVYDCNQQKAKVMGMANIDSHHNSLSADNIIYNLINRQLTANSSSPNRTSMTLTPNTAPQN